MLEVTNTACNRVIHVIILRDKGASHRVVDIMKLSSGHLRDPWNVFHVDVAVHLGCERRLVTAARVAQGW